MKLINLNTSKICSMIKNRIVSVCAVLEKKENQLKKKYTGDIFVALALKGLMVIWAPSLGRNPDIGVILKIHEFGFFRGLLGLYNHAFSLPQIYKYNVIGVETKKVR